MIVFFPLNSKEKVHNATHLMNEAPKRFYTNFINENSSSQRDLFSATRKLLKQDNETLFPPFKNKFYLARLDEMTEALPSSNPSSSRAWLMLLWKQLRSFQKVM